MPLNRAFITFPGLNGDFSVLPEDVESGTITERLNGRLIQRKVLSFEIRGINREEYTALENLKVTSRITGRYGENKTGTDLYIEGCSLENAVFRSLSQPIKVINIGGSEIIDCRIEFCSLKFEYC